MEKMGKKLCKRLQSHRLNPLNNASILLLFSLYLHHIYSYLLKFSTPIKQGLYRCNTV